MELTSKQKERIEAGRVDFSNAIIRFIMVHSDLLAYATKINLNEISKSSDELKHCVNDIKSISSEISQISFKTQMLSINASIEAARIGEHGKGFAVVATEVGKLSEQTKKSMGKIEDVNKKTLHQAEKNGQEITGVGEVLNRFSDSNKILTDVMKARTTVVEDEYIISLLALRLINHADFIVNVMNNAGTLSHVADHHECAMGKWYDANKSKYSNIREFAALESVHAEFHLLAREYNETLKMEHILGMVDVSHKILIAFLAMVDAFEARVLETPEAYIA